MPKLPERAKTRRPPAPDQHQEGTTEPTPGYAGVPNSRSVPATGTPDFDNPLNPRGISSNLTSGLPDGQATTSQKTQNPTPARPPLAATVYPAPAGERVSAGQNRKPPQEIIP